jgi:hypothetical protein
MTAKQDQILIDLQEKINGLLVENLHQKEVITQQKISMHEVKMACDVVLIHIGLVEYKYRQFKVALIKLKHLINR